MTALFWKACGASLVAAVLILSLRRQEQDLALLLGMAATVLILSAAFSVLEPVLEFLYGLQQMGQLSSETLSILMKITGIGITAEVTGLILSDSGNTSMAKGVQLMATVVILSLCLPVLELFLELLKSIVGGL